MNIGFYLTSSDPLGYVFADRLIQSIHSTMPSVHVAQLTDMTSPSVWGVDSTHRLLPAPLSLHRSDHYRHLLGNWLFVDTDVIINEDIQSVFEEPFDIAVTERCPEDLPADYLAANPYVAGVVFSRSPAFWSAVHQLVTSNPATEHWLGDQEAIGTLINSGNYNVKVLPSRFQSTDLSSDLTKAAIIHYKGPRKKQLLARIHNELGLYVR